jgi:hypothetical protein
MPTTLRTIKANQQDMKRYDNAWADKYVRDVGWLLKRVEEVREVLAEVIREHDEPMSDYGCATHTTERARALYQRLRVDGGKGE